MNGDIQYNMKLNTKQIYLKYKLIFYLKIMFALHIKL